MKRNKIRVLSLFDGISVAQEALKEKRIKCEYMASEIDKYAISITQKNFPKTKQLGDIKKLGRSNPYPKELLERTDLIVFGSPCTDLSIAKKNRQGLKGEASGLFYEAVRIIKDLKPRYFLMENVASMSKESKKEITRIIGVDPIMINASLLSAQNRKRLFWCGQKVGKIYKKVDITLPKDKGILLKDVLEDGVDENNYLGKKQLKKLKYLKGANPSFDGQPKVSIRLGKIGKGGQGDRIYSPKGKSVALSANGGGRGAKTGLYLVMTTVQTDSMAMKDGIIRKLSPTECERLQNLPNNFTALGVNERKEQVVISNTQRYKTLGNAFNCGVIKHILKFIVKIEKKNK